MSGNFRSNYPPNCTCGGGRMMIKMARSLLHHGRYYYKCPVYGQHDGHFFWCDVYHQHDPPELVPHFLAYQTYRPGCRTASSGTTNGDEHRDETSRHRPREEVIDSNPLYVPSTENTRISGITENGIFMPELIWVLICVVIVFICIVLPILGVLLGRSM
ncbi:hypothetical protein ACS0TY_023096 [Phlomoides rotata]